MSIKANLLLIEDDIPLAELTRDFLQANHFQVTHCSSGLSGLKKGKEKNFDLIICDIMLPDISGFDVVKSLKQSIDIPIIFLTAMNEDNDQIYGLELGAMDYIIKPVNPRVLLSRINNFIQHVEPNDQSTLTFENLCLNKLNHSCQLFEQDIHLTHAEFELLWLLTKYIGRPISREFLFQETVGREYDGMDRTIDARICRLRKKLENHENGLYTIKSIWGRGYQLCQQA